MTANENEEIGALLGLDWNNNKNFETTLQHL